MSEPVFALVREVFELEPTFPIDDSSGPGDIPGWDSLGTLRLVTAAEERFDLEFDLEDIAELTSISDLRRVIAKGRIP